MHINIKHQEALLLLALTLTLVSWRVIQNIFPAFSCVANFSAGGAFALFIGSRRKSIFLKCLSLFAFLWVSDLFIDRFVLGKWMLFYPGFYWVYAAFFFMIPMGMILLKKVSPGRILVAAITCTVIHWVVSDWGLFINSHVYPKSVTGWLQIMIAAIPFEFNFLAGTAFYMLIFFGIQWVLNRYARKHMMKGISSAKNIPAPEKTKS
jgi:hypothetical protein